MLTNGLYPEMHNAYCEHHSTETALLKVKNDILMNMDMGHVTLLVLLDLSATFILGDPGADSGGEGKSKRAENYGTKKSKEPREEPLGTMSY